MCSEEERSSVHSAVGRAGKQLKPAPETAVSTEAPWLLAFHGLRKPSVTDFCFLRALGIALRPAAEAGNEPSCCLHVYCAVGTGLFPGGRYT